MTPLPPLGAVLPSLALAGLVAAAIAVAVATAFYFLRARLFERMEDTLPASGAADLQGLGERIEALVGQQQLHGETQRQILSQKLDAIGQRFDEQRHAVDGLRHEMRHEAQRRDDELADIRHQIAAIQQAVPALGAPSALALGDGNATRAPEPAASPAADPAPVADVPPAPALPEPPVAEPPVAEPLADVTPLEAPLFETASFDAVPFEAASFQATAFEEASFEAIEATAFDAASFDAIPFGAAEVAPLAAPPVDEPGAPSPAEMPTAVEASPAETPAVADVSSVEEALPPADALASVPALDLPPGVTVERVSEAPPVDPFALPFEMAARAPAPAPAPPPAGPPTAPVADPFGFAFEDPFATPAAPAPRPIEPLAEAPVEPIPMTEPVTTEPVAAARVEPVAVPAPVPMAGPSSLPAGFSAPVPMSVSELVPMSPSVTSWAAEPPPAAETTWVARPDRDGALAPIPGLLPDLPGTETRPAVVPPVEAPQTFVVPEGADDLTVISSVDALVQNALYVAGVHKLDEIARWGRSDARRIAGQVGVSEDTIMNQWVFEAQAALFDQYTRQAS